MYHPCIQRVTCLRLSGVVTMGYSWLIATCWNYPCCQHAGANRGREAVGGWFLNPVLGFFSFVFVLVVPP